MPLDRRGARCSSCGNYLEIEMRLQYCETWSMREWLSEMNMGDIVEINAEYSRSCFTVFV